VGAAGRLVLVHSGPAGHRRRWTRRGGRHRARHAVHRPGGHGARNRTRLASGCRRRGPPRIPAHARGRGGSVQPAPPVLEQGHRCVSAGRGQRRDPSVAKRAGARGLPGALAPQPDRRRPHLRGGGRRGAPPGRATGPAGVACAGAPGRPDRVPGPPARRGTADRRGPVGRVRDASRHPVEPVPTPGRRARSGCPRLAAGPCTGAAHRERTTQRSVRKRLAARRVRTRRRCRSARHRQRRHGRLPVGPSPASWRQPDWPSSPGTACYRATCSSR
jgi:hypothetical protein